MDHALCPSHDRYTKKSVGPKFFAAFRPWWCISDGEWSFSRFFKMLGRGEEANLAVTGIRTWVCGCEGLLEIPVVEFCDAAFPVGWVIVIIWCVPWWDWDPSTINCGLNRSGTAWSCVVVWPEFDVGTIPEIKTHMKHWVRTLHRRVTYHEFDLLFDCWLEQQQMIHWKEHKRLTSLNFLEYCLSPRKFDYFLN